MEQKSEIKNKNKIALFGTIIIITSFIIMTIFIPQILANNDTTKDYEDISVDVAYSMINDTVSLPNLIILDIRSQSEYDSGHLNNSILIPVDELENRLNEIDEYQNIEIIVHCRSGSRSRTASEILTTNGFSKIYNMLGGIYAWIDAGYPTILENPSIYYFF
jgi:rhodanese-related sulfurtransferase